MLGLSGDVITLYNLDNIAMQTFTKAVSQKSGELSSQDLAELKLVVNFGGQVKTGNKARKMKHVIPSDKRARIIDR